MSEDVTPPESAVLSADISIEHDGWKNIEPGVEVLVDACIEAVAAHDPEEFCAGTVAILFTGDEAVQDLNSRFRGKDKPTNVLSFPANEHEDEPHEDETPEEQDHHGDIALAYETCEREAKEQGIALKDHAAHLILHGILHVFGYDHEDDTEADIMEKLETDLLAGMGIADPYA